MTLVSVCSIASIKPTCSQRCSLCHTRYIHFTRPTVLSALTSSCVLYRRFYMWFCYSAPVGVRSIVINPSVCASVCLFVCPQAYLWNRWTDLHEILCADACGRGSVLLRQRCATLCTFGFMDDVTSDPGDRISQGHLNRGV